MFEKACKKIRESLYGVIGSSVTQRNGSQVNINATNGTAFMVAPGYLITAAHFVHQENNPAKPIHRSFEIIRTPNIGQKMEKATYVDEDTIHDIALLKVENPKDAHVVVLEKNLVLRGVACGFLGFPLANVQFMPDGQRNFNLFERFQGAHVSNHMIFDKGQLNEKMCYEVDNMMYPGSSGCPAFTSNAKVFGMQIASEIQKRSENDQIERVAISLLVPSTDILDFLKSRKIKI